MGESGDSSSAKVETRKIDFSIEGLLKEPYVEKKQVGDFDNIHIQYADSGTFQPVRRFSESCLAQGKGSDEGQDETEENRNFSWLFCSRFKPPKLPRSKKRTNSKRYGRGPRIPFAAHQITVLENAFRKSHYLSPDCINRLAETLYLSENRVKIWFQNRRARFRREQESLALNTTLKSGTSTQGDGEKAEAEPSSGSKVPNSMSLPVEFLRVSGIFPAQMASLDTSSVSLHEKPLGFHLFRGSKTFDLDLWHSHPGALAHPQTYRQSRSLSPEVLMRASAGDSLPHSFPFSTQSAFVPVKK